MGLILDLRLPISLQKTLYVVSGCVLNRIGGSENWSRSLFSAVPTDLAASPASVSGAVYIVAVHMYQGIRSSSIGLKM